MNPFEVKVSVILSVYNAERFLKKCLGSLAHQTLDEMEIISVNNGSTDGSGEILEAFRKEFPEKFRVITLEKNTGDPAEPWNMGIDAAQGEYVSIVDSDDWCDMAMFQTLYEAAQKYDAEAVLCDHYEVYGKDNRVRSKINANAGLLEPAELMKNPHMAPWGKIIRKDVYTRNHLRYKSQIHCDTGMNLILYGFLQRIAYVDEPFYYYNQMNPNSETNTKKRMRQATITDTLDHILEHYNRKWEDEVVFDVVRFLYWFCFTEYFFHQDIFIPFIRKHEREIRRNKYLKANREGLQVVFEYFKKEMVPKRFIYSTFGGKKLSAVEKECIASWNKYTTGYELVELNEKNCSVEENSFIRDAYRSGDIQRVADYFLLRELYERGGILLSTFMEMRGPIGELRMHKLTVGYDSARGIGDGVIAAIPCNPVVRQACEHILCAGAFRSNAQEDEEDSFWETEKENRSAVSSFFESYLKEHNYYLFNQNALLQNDIVILASDRLYYEINQNSLFRRIYPQIHEICEKPFITLHENAIESYVGYINRLEDQCRIQSAELARISNSRSWRYTEPIRKVFRALRWLKAKIFSKYKKE